MKGKGWKYKKTQCFSRFPRTASPAKPEIHKKVKKTWYFSQYFFESRNVDTTSGRTMCKKHMFFNGFQRSLIRNIRFFRVFRCRFPRAPPPGTRQLCLIKRNYLAVAQKQNCCRAPLWRLVCCNLLDGTVSARPGPTQRGPTRPGPTRGSSLLVSLLKVSEAIWHALICFHMFFYICRKRSIY